jgi:hypothetical protein
MPHQKKSKSAIDTYPLPIILIDFLHRLTRNERKKSSRRSMRRIALFPIQANGPSTINGGGRPLTPGMKRNDGGGRKQRQQDVGRKRKSRLYDDVPKRNSASGKKQKLRSVVLKTDSKERKPVRNSLAPERKGTRQHQP